MTANLFFQCFLFASFSFSVLNIVVTRKNSIFASKLKRCNNEFESTPCPDELPSVWSMGSISHLYGNLSEQYWLRISDPFLPCRVLYQFLCLPSWALLLTAGFLRSVCWDSVIFLPACLCLQPHGMAIHKALPHSFPSCLRFIRLALLSTCLRWH